MSIAVTAMELEATRRQEVLTRSLESIYRTDDRAEAPLVDAPQVAPVERFISLTRALLGRVVERA